MYLNALEPALVANRHPFYPTSAGIGSARVVMATLGSIEPTVGLQGCKANWGCSADEGPGDQALAQLRAFFWSDTTPTPTRGSGLEFVQSDELRWAHLSEAQHLPRPQRWRNAVAATVLFS